MAFRLRYHSTLLLTLALAVSVQGSGIPRQPSAPIPGKFIVKLSEQAKPEAVGQSLGKGNRLKKAFRANLNLELPYPGNWDRFYIFYAEDKQLTSQDVTRLLGRGNIEYVEPDYTVEFYDLPQDDLFSNQWYLYNTGQEYLGVVRVPGDENDYLTLKTGTPGADAGLVGYYMTSPAEHTRVVVAIVDTGVDPEHPQLQGQFWTNTDEIPDNGIDDDHNGYIDDIIGWDPSGDVFDYYLEPDPDNVPNDLHGHGTHIAGIVAARADAEGVVGVAPNATIMAVSIHPNNSVSTCVEALVYAVNSGAQIINISWGTVFESDALREAVEFARKNNVFIAMAAGNTANDLFGFPQSYEPSFVVAAGNSDGYMASFSNRGPLVDVVAPGLDILSLRGEGTDMYAPDEPEIRIIGDDGLYYLSDGTSMSAPVVCGAAAILLAVKPNMTVGELEDYLRLGATDIVDPFNTGEYYPGPDTISGYGNVSVDGSLALLELEGIFIVEPQTRYRYTGDVIVKAAATGGYTGSWELTYTMNPEAAEWITLASGSALPIDSVIYVLGEEVPDGIIYLRLTDKYDASTLVSFLHVSRRYVEITAPVPDQEIRFGLELRGSAFGPDFDSVAAVVQQNGTTIPLMVSAGEYFDSLICTWVFNGVDTGQCTLQLTGYYPGEQLSDAVVFRITSGLTPGWPATVDGYRGPTLAAADMNRDGIMEVIATSSNGVFAFHGDGTTVEGFPVRTGVDMRSAPAIYDVDRDGEDEIICTGANGIHVFNYDGSYADGWPQMCYTGMNGLSFPSPTVTKLGLGEDSAIVIINRDGEILAYEFNGDSYFYSLEGLFATYDLPPTATYRGGANLPMVTSADFNGDGLREVLSAYTAINPTCGLAVFDGRTGQPAFDLEAPLVTNIRDVFGTILTDFDGDNLPEVVTIGQGLDEITYVWVKSPDFSDYPGWPIALPEAEYWGSCYPTVGDLDLDGVPEILLSFYNYNVSRLYIFRSDGTPYRQLEDQPIGVAFFDYSEISTPVVANITGDENPEITIFTGFMLPGAGPERVVILDHLARPIPGLEIQTQATIYQALSWEYPPLVDDIDSDGLAELLVVSNNWDLLAWDFDAAFDGGSPGRFLVDNLNSNIFWPASIETGVDSQDSALPTDVVLTQNYPNPFNPTTRLSFELPRHSNVNLSVYNVLGQRVATLIDRDMAAGHHEIEFDGAGLASGIYMYRLETDQGTVAGKMMLIK